MGTVAPTIPIDIGGRTRNLRYDFNALVLVEEKTGKSALSGEMFNNIRASSLRVFLWAGLIHEDDSLTVEKVGEWIHMGNLQEVTEAIGRAFQTSMKEPEEARAPLEGDQGNVIENVTATQ